MWPLLGAPEVFCAAVKTRPCSVTPTDDIQPSSDVALVSGRDQMLLPEAATE